MPTLRHLIEELKRLMVDPDDVRIPGTLYDEIVADAEESDEEGAEDEED